MLGALTPKKRRARVLLDASHADDAGAVRLEGERALLHTVDVITPIVDDPATFGRIAATNAISDIYAMGGQPTSAVSVLGLPKELPRAALEPMLSAARDALDAAGAHLVGGHTLKDRELRLGFAVTGEALAKRLTTHRGARPGQLLVLTKPLGTGLLYQRRQQGDLSAADEAAWVASMIASNAAAAERMQALGVRAATDVTGFGLGGHAASLARGSDVDLVFDPRRLPTLPGVGAALDAGCATGAGATNLRGLAAVLRLGRAPEGTRQLVGDPQTSGGLLFALPPRARGRLEGLPCWVVGRVEARRARSPAVRLRRLELD